MLVDERKLWSIVDIENNFDQKMRTLSEELDMVNSKLKGSEIYNQNLSKEIMKKKNKKTLRDVEQGLCRISYLSSTSVKSENDVYKSLRCKMLAEMAVLGSDTTETHIIIDQMKQRLNRLNKQLKLLDDERPILLFRKLSERRQYEEYFRSAHERIEMLISKRDSLKVQNEKLNTFPNFEEMKRVVVDLLEKIDKKNKYLKDLKKSYKIMCELHINVAQNA
uniref:DUF4201 domain-containing protein n=1 Tax=Romanomermis culicivorax TaxID=13658 RepID=A0A915KWH1_ROMCU